MWFLPTKGRADCLQRLLDKIIEIGNSTPGLVIVNGEDPSYSDIRLPKLWQMHVLPENLGLCGAMNWAFDNYPREPWYGLITDDELVHTPEWDETLVKAAGNWNISHGNEGWQSENRMHSSNVFGGDLIRTVGYWAPAGLWHWFIDNVWENIATDCDLRRYCREVRTEHKHYLAGKSLKDETYRLGESRSLQDEKVFRKWMENEFPHICALIKERKNETAR